MVDYDEIGLKCGIEIHQRLKTGRKLFCHCSSRLAEDRPVLELERRLRPVAGETGEIDPAALYERMRGRTFKYQAFQDQTCLVETDGEPPFPFDAHALEIALEVAKLLKMEVPDEIHVMRKTVVDGSNTGGFQRTAVVGLGTEKSVIETSQGEVRLKDLELEEESAGIVEDSVFRLDRLGIPLVEVGTHPDIFSPEQAYETALAIGQLLRLTSVQRGLGTIRQDVNVSVEGGARVEIKGLQEIEDLPDLVRKECERQVSLLELVSVANLKEFDLTVYDVTKLFLDTKNKLIKKELEEGGSVFAGVLPLKGLMNRELCEGRTLGKELAGYAAAYGPNGIIHSEEDLKKYGLLKEFAIIPLKGEVKFIVAGENAEKAAEEVVKRAQFLGIGVPEETRSALPDGLTTYSRPLPGKERMYPETDVPPVRVTQDLLDSVELPKSVEERRKFLVKLGLSTQQVDQLVLHEKYTLFEEAAEISDPKLTAVVFLEILPHLRREGVDVASLSEDQLLKILEEGKSLDKSAMEKALRAAVEKGSAKGVVFSLESKHLSEGELEKEMEKLVEEKKRFIEREGDRAFAGLMGEATERLPDQDASLIAKLLKKLMP